MVPDDPDRLHFPRLLERVSRFFGARARPGSESREQEREKDPGREPRTAHRGVPSRQWIDVNARRREGPCRQARDGSAGG